MGKLYTSKPTHIPDIAPDIVEDIPERLYKIEPKNCPFHQKKCLVSESRYRHSLYIVENACD